MCPLLLDKVTALTDNALATATATVTSRMAGAASASIVVCLSGTRDPVLKEKLKSLGYTIVDSFNKVNVVLAASGEVKKA